MKVLFATSECAPWVKTGGLGDVSAALPHALAALGHDVRVLIPAYGPLRDLLPDAQLYAELPAQGMWPAARLLLVPQLQSFTLFLLDAPELYATASGPYQDENGRDHADASRRFAFLSLVAAQLASSAGVTGVVSARQAIGAPQNKGTGVVGAKVAARSWHPDVLHCNDWPTGLAPAFLREQQGACAPSVMTVHNLAYQGLFPMETITTLGLPEAWRDIEGAEFWGKLSCLKAGLQYADAITTVSPTYAREIGTEALGCGLHGLLQARAADVHGILNGIDTAVWNPSTDRLLARRYSADKLAGKRANKTALLQRFGLADDAPRMVFGVVSRLAEQKGIDLVVQSIPWLVANDCQLVVLGTGDAALQDQLTAAAAAHPDRIGVTLGFDETLAHLIEAGSDVFLMPSRYEPCGLNQMYSQVYGTPPVVHGTGGLADSVRDYVAAPDASTGFVMPEASLPALQAAMAQALLVHRQPARWRELQQRGMAQDFGWAASASRYVALYRSLMPAPVTKVRTKVG